MSLTFKNTTVSIDVNYGYPIVLHANEATISESVDITRVPSLGQTFSFTDVYSNKPVGQFSATYYLHNNDQAVRDLVGATFFDGTIGDYGFTNGVLTSYSLSAEPDSLVRASLGVTFFQGIEDVVAASPPQSQEKYAHGNRTNIDPVGAFFNNNLFSFEYSISQSINPLFFLGQTSISAADFTEGSVNFSLEGQGLGGSISYPCLDRSSVTVKLKNVCGVSIGTITEANMNVESSELALSEREGLVGSITLFKNI